MSKRPYAWRSFSQVRFPSRSWQASWPARLPPTYDQTCLPSVLHEAEASLALSGFPRSRPVLDSVFRHFSLPSLPRQSRTTSSPAVEVRKMRSPQMHGVDSPWPGMGNFQTTFLSGPHSVGRPFSAEWPSFLRPRHCGQLSAEAGAIAKATSAVTSRTRRVMGEVAPERREFGGMWKTYQNGSAGATA